METRTGNFYEVTVRYEKEMPDGGLKRISEVFAIDALSFSEAEGRMIKEMETYKKSYQNYEIKAIKKAPYKEIFFGDENDEDIKYYNATLSFIELDEKTEKEKRTNTDYLIMASNFKLAVRHIDEAMKGSGADYESISVKESKVVDTLLHDDEK